MGEFGIDRRTLLRGVAGAGALAAFPSGEVAAQVAEETDPTTRATYRAVVDAVIPETPKVAEELGEEHGPGGLQVGLDAYLIEYVNTLFSFWDAPNPEGEFGAEFSFETPDESPEDAEVGLSPEFSYQQRRESNARLAEVVAKVCDAAATELLARGENESRPVPTRFEAGGPFASLARRDRLYALALLDEKEVDTADLPGPVVEGTAGLVPQLVVAFTQVVYYSEWQGYEDLSAPPSEREFSETVDGERLQSWAQTDFPGIIDGAAAFRGYWGAPDSPLGEGRVWKTFADGDGPPRQLYFEPGEFAEDDYDTRDYAEPFDTGSDPAGGPFGQDETADVQRPEEAVEDARDGVEEGLLDRAEAQFFGTGDGSPPGGDR
jgi:hypothetical protein